MWQWAFCLAIVFQVHHGSLWHGVAWGLCLLLLPLVKGIRPLPSVLLALSVGGLWAAWHLEQGLAARVPAQWIGESLSLEGEVLPFSWQETQTHYGAPRYGVMVKVKAVAGQQRHRGILRLAYYPNPEEQMAPLFGGERVRFTAKLKPPHGTLNEGLVSSQQLDLARGVIGRGTVVAWEERDGAAPGLSRWREALSARLTAQLAPWPKAQRLVPALMVADRRHITTTEWQQYRESGTAHLLAISGLHVSLVAGACWWLFRHLLIRIKPLAHQATLYAVLPAFLATLAYAALAGFSLPTQRALLMCAAFMGSLVARQEVAVFSGLRWAAVGVLAWAPLSVLDPSFWLSFGAVAALLCLLAISKRLVWWRAQLLLSLGVGALGAWWYGAWGLLSPLANGVLIPLFAWCIVPLGFLLVLGVPAHWVAPVLELAIGFSDTWLQWLAPLQWQLKSTLGPMALLGVVLGALLLVVPRAPMAKVAVLPLFLPWWWPQHALPEQGEFDYVVFDVGQGLASVIRTRHHLLLYDTGPTWGQGDAGQSILVPWLKKQPQGLSLGILSHSDSDHTGGFAAVHEAWPGVPWLAGEPGAHSPVRPCWRGQQWQWDGVNFTVLWPPAGLKLQEHNNYSCVLLVKGKFGTVLLTGDIHRPVEFWLARHEPLPEVDVLQVPHHGSRTSSSFSFLKRVQPRLALASHGYANGFGHPHAQVVNHYKALNIPLFSTAEGGMIVFPSREYHNSTPIQWRYRYPRRWYFVD